MTLKNAIESYLSALRRRGYSARTISAYSFDLGKLSQHLAKLEMDPEKIDIREVDTELLRDWADDCLDRGNSARTLARKMATCKSFFRFLESEKIIETNPVVRISLPKTPKTPPDALSQDEVRQLIASPDPESPDYLRNRAIMMLLYSAGLRVSEIVSLQMEGVQLDRQSVRVHGKGAKDRILPLSDSTRQAILAYFLEREKVRSDSMIPRSPAFITSKGKPMTVRMIQYMVEKHGLKAGIPVHVHPHLIRHSIATHLIEEGCNVEAVRQTLGHEDLATTSIYLKTSSKFLRDEHKKFNPIENLTKDHR